MAFITPIAPSPVGNGLAMRAFLFLSAASRDFGVKVLIVPVAGEAGGTTGDSAVTLSPPDRAELRAALPELLGSPRWRGRITQAYPLPSRARLAPVTLAPAAISALDVPPGTPVHVTRSYLSPLGVRIAEQLGSRWASLDLDEDDEQLSRTLGDHEDANAYHRLVSVFGPLFQAVALAAPGEAAAIGQGHGLATTVIPNAVSLPDHDSPAPVGERAESAGRGRLESIGVLFAGNLTYQPNADAAVRLVRDWLPRLRGIVDRPVTVTLVGEPNDTVRGLAAVPGVQVTGFVPDLAACYRAADVVAIPLAAGGGTRIKLLEAFAYGVPVVTSSAGAAGLDLADGVHVLLAEDADGAARAVAALTADSELRARLVAQARRLVSRSYSYEAVIPRIREFFASAQCGAVAGSGVWSG